MSSARRNPPALWAALTLTLCAACDRAPQGSGAPMLNRSESPAASPQWVVFDRQPPGSENRVSILSGTPGTLRYRPGCLFIDDGHGGQIGLVVPSYVKFDGKRMMGKLKSPDGERFGLAIGEFVNLTGRVIENPRNGSYSCDTKQVLIADYF